MFQLGVVKIICHLSNINFLIFIKINDNIDLFLNTSITEAFCIANVEAASSGLMVVSTVIKLQFN